MEDPSISKLSALAKKEAMVTRETISYEIYADDHAATVVAQMFAEARDRGYGLDLLVRFQDAGQIEAVWEAVSAQAWPEFGAPNRTPFTLSYQRHTDAAAIKYANTNMVPEMVTAAKRLVTRRPEIFLLESWWVFRTEEARYALGGMILGPLLNACVAEGGKRRDFQAKPAANACVDRLADALRAAPYAARALASTLIMWPRSGWVLLIDRASQSYVDKISAVLLPPCLPLG